MANSELKKISRESLVEALIYLCDKKDFSEITISEICNKAGVSRMAFYRNYKTKEDIFRFYLDDIVSSFTHQLEEWVNEDLYSYKNNDILIPTFNYFKNYQSFFECLKKANLGTLAIERITKYEFDHFYDKEDPKFYFMINAFSGALYSTYQAWLANGFKEDPKYLSEIISAMFNVK